MVKVVVAQGFDSEQGLQPGGGILCVAQGDGAVERHDRIRLALPKQLVEIKDGLPVGLFPTSGLGMVRSNGRFEVILAYLAPHGAAREVHEAPGDQRLVPMTAILVFQQYDLPAGVEACAEVRGLKAEQREQGLGFCQSDDRVARQ